MRVACVLVLAAGTAQADDALHRRLAADEDRHYLEIDPLPPPILQSLENKHAGQRTDVTIDPHTKLTLSYDQWANDDRGPLPAKDLAARGWRSGIRIVRDLGPLQLIFTGAYAELDQTYSANRYVDVGISIGRTWRLSRWMTAWIMLGVGRRNWLGKAPDGERDATTLQLTIGTTFR